MAAKKRASAGRGSKEKREAPVANRRAILPVLVAVSALLAAAALLGFWALRPGSAALQGPGTNPRANLVLITLDTTRADHIGAYGYSGIETPRIDALSREGVRFEHAFSSIPLTLPAHSSIMTGSLPVHHHVRDNGGFFLGKEQRTLAEILHERGFATAAFVGAFVLNRHWGLDQGFDAYDDEFGPEDPREAVDLHQQRDGAEVADHAIRWIEQHAGQQFFVWVHFYDPHYPYEPKGAFAEKYRAAPYDGEIAYTDGQVGRVIDCLRSKGLYDSTLIVVEGDHGEGLGQHDEPDHGIFLYDSTLRVPLIVRTPASAYRGTVHGVVRDIDVMPTLLEYLEIPSPESVRGKSLLSLMAGREEPEGRYAYGETAYVRYHYGWKELASVRSQRYKYVDLPRPELYDLEQDPGEARNLASARPETARDLQALLQEQRNQAGGGALERPAALDPESAARLQSLGYLGNAPSAGAETLADAKDKLDVLDVLIQASRQTGNAMKSGQYAEAAATVERAIALEPNFMDGYQFLGTLYLRLGRPDEAIAALRKILEVNPESAQARMALAKCYMVKRDFKTALSLADALLATSPRYVAAYYAAEDALVEMGREDDAIVRMRRLIQTVPEARLAPYEIGRLLLAQGKVEEARLQIQSALEIEPRTRSAHFNLGVIAEQRGDRDLAVLEYTKELELYPANVEALTNLGILRMQRRETELGVATFERLVAAEPGAPAGYYLLARALSASGRADGRALELARRASSLDAGNPRFRSLVRELEARKLTGSP